MAIVQADLGGGRRPIVNACNAAGSAYRASSSQHGCSIAGKGPLGQLCAYWLFLGNVWKRQDLVANEHLSMLHWH